MNPEQFRSEVIIPSLKYIELYSEDAAELLLATAIQESHLFYIKQLDNGPAVSVYQIEPATHNDVWVNYLSYRMHLALRVKDLHTPAFINDPHRDLMVNMAYATAIARIIYRRVPEKLPSRDDVPAMAAYWKKYYNTIKGKGTEDEFIENYHRHVHAMGG